LLLLLPPPFFLLQAGYFFSQKIVAGAEVLGLNGALVCSLQFLGELFDFE
jgi:hypothetical protein